ncbi:HypA protein [Pseudomassariella vexata]|uniref:HypA protein n=1 Tax=Pseudomassariella vexata TaxID=1141098 RepID=A0A1Y2EK38_9PEZI|nr:HypA protein [Pseudomassariella vexata]ORY71923.1 HypA protein [Pseudomassariella vexata]
MATAYKIKITPENTGLWHFGQDESAAEKATELLQKDMNQHHVFFNDGGFHNHISHHILALYGTGASAEDLVKGYIENEGYQRPSVKAHGNLVEDLKDWEKAKKHLGKAKYYTDWLHFYQHEIERLGWQKALAEYMFKGDERCEDMMVRMFSGFLHPLIQLMYGVEWDQPAIVAMALAQACVHEDELRKLLITAEEKAKSAPTPMPTIVSLLNTLAKDDKLRNSPRLDDSNKIRDGVLARAWEEAIKYCGQVKVLPEELDQRTAEMFNAAIYEASCAAVYPGKDPKYEFFLIHHVNVSPIFIVLNKQDWISTENKVRILEWKIRMDLLQYAARGCPKILVDKIALYVPKDKNPGPTIELLPRMHNLVEDGHAIKLFRAIGVGQHVSKPYEDEQGMFIKGDLWNKVGHLVADSVEAPGPTWVRNAGFDEAWKDVADRPSEGGKVSL